MDAIRKSRIRLRKNSFSAVIIPYISTIVCYSLVVHVELNAIYRIRIAVCKCLLSTRKNCIAVVKENARRKKPGFIFEKVLDFLSPLWYVVALTEKAVPFHKPFWLVFCSFVKRTMARKHHSRGGQQKQLEGDEGTTRIHGKALRGLRKNLHRRAEGNLRKVPRSEVRND